MASHLYAWLTDADLVDDDDVCDPSGVFWRHHARRRWRLTECSIDNIVCAVLAGLKGLLVTDSAAGEFEPMLHVAQFARCSIDGATGDADPQRRTFDCPIGDQFVCYVGDSFSWYSEADPFGA